MKRFVERMAASVLVAVLCVSAPASTAAPKDGFNEYVLRAVKKLQGEYPSKGYDIHKAYTHTIPYADGTVQPTDAPWTMCVAAVAEAIITAINLYVEETGDRSPYTFLPVANWNRMRPTDLRAHIWVDPKLDSAGTADALVTFGIGKRVKFSELTPGSFINLNRNRPKRPSGHAVIFLSYLDEKGNELSSYSNEAVGFKYWSAQGKANVGDAGYAYRYAFLNHVPDQKGNCPDLGPGKKVDCWIMNSKSTKYLNMGYMLMPSLWDKKIRDKNLSDVVYGLYEQTRSRGPNAILTVPEDIQFVDFERALNDTDTMMLNPIFNADASTD